MSRAKRGDVRAVLKWLARVFPAPGDLRWKLVWDRELKGSYAECDWETRQLHLDDRYPTEVVISNLMHEWAHVRDRREHDGNLVEHHDNTFYLELGRIERRYMEEGGAVEVGEIS